MTEPVSSHFAVERPRKHVQEAKTHVAAVAGTTFGIAWGVDPESVVRAAVNHDGGVVAVQIHPRWKSRLDGKDIGPAIVAAASAAAQALAEGRTEPAPPAQSDPPPRSRSMPPAGVPETVRWWLRDLLNDAESSVALLRDRVEQVAAEEVTGRSASGRVSATARGGALVRVDCSPHWLRDVTREQLQTDVLEALAAALPGQSHRVDAAMRGVGRLGELLDLAADPIQLMAALGAVAPPQSSVRHATA